MGALQNTVSLPRLLLIVCFFVSTALVQELKEPKRIYEQGFVGGVFKQAGKPTPKTAKNRVTTETKEQEDAHEPAGLFEPEVQATPFSADAEQEDVFGDQRGTPVVWVGAILESSDSQHLKENLEELTSLSTRFDWMLGPVLIIGVPDKKIVAPYVLKISARSGVLQLRPEIPEKYKAVKQSPTWIVQTAKGQVLLEAVGNIKKFFNKKGELLIEKNPIKSEE